MSGPDIRRFADPPALLDAAAREMVEQIEASIRARGQCRLALAGGSTPRPLYERLAKDPLAERIDWGGIHVFWTDERCVSPDDERSNYRMVRDAMLSRVPIPEPQVHRIEGEREPPVAASRYAEVLGDAPLDVVLLGMGGDGHVASLFPGTSDLGADARAVATTSPVPPTQRVSLGLRALNEARVVLCLVAGAAKADRVAEAIAQAGSDSPELPAAMVRPRDGVVTWFVDAEAAGRL